VNLTNRTLQRTTFQAGSGATINIGCSTGGCSAKTVVFTRPIECPVSAGQTCSFFLHLESQASVSVNDDGFFGFLVDGVAPVPGQTDPKGLYAFNASDPNSDHPSARSSAIIAKVKNTTTNQLHTIEVDIGCTDQTGDGCSAGMGFRTLSTSVYTP
jgi:hypothetical protein